jgi:hypothetical protein
MAEDIKEIAPDDPDITALDAADATEELWELEPELLELILRDRLEWRAWARAMQAAGRWAE